MAEWIRPEAIKAARKADLYSYLLRHHPDAVETEGNSLRLRTNHSVSLKQGWSGWRDFATGETGNAIDFLTGFLGYEMQDAVKALCADMGIQTSGAPSRPPRNVQPKSAPQTRVQAAPRAFTPPAPLQGQYRQLYAYLTRTRGIPAPVVQQLIHDDILYQDADHANAVFINPSRTFVELRGTNTFTPYHQVQFSDPAAFWWLKAHGLNSIPTVAYVCEGSIDAVSLYLLRRDVYPDENGLYCGIGGVANQQRIDAIKAGMAAAGLQTVIAVDNDEAGAECRRRNADCSAVIPSAKDWNEDWLNSIAKQG